MLVEPLVTATRKRSIHMRLNRRETWLYGGRQSMSDHKLLGHDYTTPDLIAKVTGRAKLSDRRHVVLQAAPESDATLPGAPDRRQRGAGDARSQGHSDGRRSPGASEGRRRF